MGFGHDVDLIAGRLSRILHGLRGPKENTAGDLSAYFDMPIAELNPAPPPLPDGSVRVHDSVVARFLRTTTLSWPSVYPILSPAYARRHEADYGIARVHRLGRRHHVDACERARLLLAAFAGR